MARAIVGANWGDEGKGKITDMLAQESDIVIRFQGGSNAGHTIINNYGRFAMHLLPSGVFSQHTVNIIGNGVFSVFVIVAKCVITILDLLQTPFEKRTRGISYLFISLLRFLFNVVLFVFMFIGNIILSANSRNNEYQADEFAFTIGFGEDLIESLYLLQKMSLGEEMELVERMTASHPLIAKRIGRLETLQEQESEKEGTDGE